MLLGTGTTCTGCCRPASARSAVLLGRASSSPCSTSTSLRIRQGLRMTATPEDAPQPSPSCSPQRGDEALFLFKAHLAASSADGRSLSSLPLAAAATAAALLLLASPDGSWAAEPNHLFDLAESEDFWGNVVRYGRYFVTGARPGFMHGLPTAGSCHAFRARCLVPCTPHARAPLCIPTPRPTSHAPTLTTRFSAG